MGMRESNIVVLATSNLDKVKEFKALFKAHTQLNVAPAKEFLRNADKLKYVETYHSYEENSLAKARTINLACHYPALGDDSGLEIQGLDQKPGPLSARYAIPKAGEGQDEANVQKVLSELKGKKDEDRKAKFTACLSVVMEGLSITAHGELHGTIIEEPRGTNGFGYDPIFVPEGETRTLAEMTQDEKNKISHRAKAFDHLLELLSENRIEWVKP
ncbi:MAG: non-canonical purine NTP pyrophosphatase, RdgB/HAM1 family [Bdellovibrionaceae bacterium]|nr:non-canonical purine NTP pyrophosphatase, RdgB/HAM1 family [Pseudobdellovibrionaceae bacterium]|tara:strand:+ start:385 stop:1029 length:645 start_codon:yes stop_codon:yes gene_type:complete